MNLPTSMEEFNQQASKFIQKAREAGKSEIGIANTIKFMYQMTLDNIKAQDEKLSTQVVNDAYGNPMLIDTQTGNVIKSYDTKSSDSDLANLELSIGGTSPVVTQDQLDKMYQELGVPSATDLSLAPISPSGKSDVSLEEYDPMSPIGKSKTILPLNTPTQNSGLSTGVQESPFKGIF